MTTEPFSLRSRVRQIYEAGDAVSPAQITDAVLDSMTASERRAALAPALAAYVGRFVAQMRSAGVSGMALAAVLPDPGEGTSASRRPPDGVPPANPVVSGRKKSGYDALVDALSVRLHGAPGPEGWITLAEASPAHLRFAARVSRRAAEGAYASAERYERWAGMVERAQVPTFGKLSDEVLSAELLARRTA